MAIETSEDGIRLRPDCPVGAAWFSQRIPRRADAPAATIDGEPADVDSALVRAAELLRGARRPLVQGFDGATVEDARAAVALADRLGALMSTGTFEDPWPGAPAVALRGASSATLGEIRDRSQLVVIWREDPETTHPRLLERLGFAEGSERTLVVVDDNDTASARRADAHIRWPRDDDLAALTSLHVLQKGLALRPGRLVAEASDLMKRLSAVPHAAFVYGAGLTGGAGGQRRALALHELVRSLGHDRHVVTLELPSAPGARSADDVLAWQSGYAGAVDFAVGHPEPVTTSLRLDDFDVTLLVASGAARVAGRGGEVRIRTAAAGVEATGTAHRLDGVPVTLQAPQPGDAPTAAALLTRLLAQVGR